jgi:hypothetical protein
MHLLHEELARARIAERRAEAALETRSARLATRRWSRRAEAASRLARLALAAVR